MKISRIAVVALITAITGTAGCNYSTSKWQDRTLTNDEASKGAARETTEADAAQVSDGDTATESDEIIAPVAGVPAATPSTPTSPIPSLLPPTSPVPGATSPASPPTSNAGSNGSPLGVAPGTGSSASQTVTEPGNAQFIPDPATRTTPSPATTPGSGRADPDLNRNHSIVATAPATAHAVAQPAAAATPRVLPVITQTNGSINVITRDSTGQLHLCQGSAGATKWFGSTDPNNPNEPNNVIPYADCTQIPTSGNVVGQASAVYRESVDGGEIHIFARTQSRKISQTVCPAKNPTLATCTAVEVPHTLTDDSPSAVALNDGTVFLFSRSVGDSLSANQSDANGVFLPELPFGPIKGAIQAAGNRALAERCSDIWGAPTAVVKDEGNGRQSITVFARSSNALDGYITMAALPEASDPAQRNEWTCATHDRMTGMTLGSSPAVVVNALTNQFEIFGMEHAGATAERHAVHWQAREDALSFSSNLGGAPMWMKWEERPSAVFVPGTSADPNLASLEFFYRSNQGKLIHASVPAAQNIFDAGAAVAPNVVSEEIPASHFIGFSAPAAVVAPDKTVHVFVTIDQTSCRNSPLTCYPTFSLLHFYKAPGAADWTEDHVRVPSAENEASPTVLWMPVALETVSARTVQ